MRETPSTPRRRGLALLVVATALVGLSCDSSLTIFNDSSYALVEINLSPVGARSWGGNLVRGDVLAPGESLTVDLITCGTYDVRVIDETGVECVIGDLALCFSNDSWVISDQMLDSCAFGG